MRKIVDWINTHSGLRDFWDYSIPEREKILGMFPELPAAHMDLGDGHYQVGNLAEAQKHVRRAIDMGYPLPGLGYNYLACIAASRNHIQKAVDHFGQAKRLGIHFTVEKNLKSLREWLVSDGLQSGNRPHLIANHHFETYQQGKQPALPASITLQDPTALPSSPPNMFMPLQ